jgi:hypothetical protein
VVADEEYTVGVGVVADEEYTVGVGVVADEEVGAMPEPEPVLLWSANDGGVVVVVLVGDIFFLLCTKSQLVEGRSTGLW